MKKIYYDREFFNIKDTLECGQVFRFNESDTGYMVFSLDKCAKLYYEGAQTVILCEDRDVDYFYHYFDLERDYQSVYNSALNENIEYLEKSAKAGKGIRILNQNKFECLVSFMISQNNNIKRIKTSINELCYNLGEKKSFLNEEYFAFPSIEKLNSVDVQFYQEIGLGYRAPYLKKLAQSLLNGFDVEKISSLPTKELVAELTKIYGVGNKVANCVTLFSYGRGDSFPVDTWIEKVYRENMNGKLTDRNKISKYLVDRFLDNSGIYQQYLFYYKKSLENK